MRQAESSGAVEPDRSENVREVAPSDDPSLAELERLVRNLVASDRVRLMAYPAVAVKLGQLLSDEQAGVAEVSKVVSADPTLAGAVLRLATSANYHRGGTEIATMAEAVGRIGLKGVHHVALATGLGREQCKVGPLQELRFLLWRWSVSSALFCQQLAGRRRMDPNQAFLAGLLHSFGKSVTLSAIEQVLEEHPRELSLPPHHWLNLVESQQRAVRMLIGRRWQLPPLVHAIVTDSPEGVEDSGVKPLFAICRLAEAVIDAADRFPTLTPKELVGIPGFLDDNEIFFAADLMTHLPAAVHALLESPAIPSRIPGKPPPPKSAVAAPKTSLRGLLHEVSFTVVDTKDRSPKEYRVTHAATDSGLLLVGPASMQVNSIVRLEFPGADGPFTAWARVTLSEAVDRGHYRVEVQPFAQGRDDRERWDGVIEAHRRQAS